ncbi:hypothetical protein FBEOM_2271 [Fusarium beomiforme]|uniref:Uncharacterized protein n=1 Tax=Fusarium beomiforme TaxID=44412 RepID=A0A9P5E2N6_9HYPO|nr:hypothetical protein FBEOM_2271 [Fusarium beomiforme]
MLSTGRRVKSRIAELQQRVAQYEGITGSIEAPEPQQQPASHNGSGHPSLSHRTSSATSNDPRNGAIESPGSTTSQRRDSKGTSNHNINPILFSRDSLAKGFPANYQMPEPAATQSQESSRELETHRTSQKATDCSDIDKAPEATRVQQDREFETNSITRRNIDGSDRQKNTFDQNWSFSLSQHFPTLLSTTAPLPHSFTTGGIDEESELDFLIGNTEVDTWKSCSYDKSTGRDQRPPHEAFPATRAESASVRLPSYAQSSHSSKVDSTASLNDRIGRVMECVGATGFESFDDVVTSYYCDEFEGGSKLFHEQRFSRLRRLPAVLTDILEGARKWDPAEHRGVSEEVLKEADAVLLLEGSQTWLAVKPLVDYVTVGRQNSLAAHLHQNLGTVIPTEIIIVTKRVITKTHVTAAIYPSTVTIHFTFTETSTETANGTHPTATSIVFDPVIITSTRTNTFTAITPVNITNTVGATTTIAPPMGFTAILENQRKKHTKPYGKPRAISGSTVPLWAQRVKCTHELPLYLTKTISNQFAIGDITDYPSPIRRTQYYNTTFVTTLYPTSANTTVTTTIRETTTKWVETKTKTTVTDTYEIDIVYPTHTMYAACHEHNILLVANRGNRVWAWKEQKTDREITLIGHNMSRTDCCSQCMKRPNCRVSMLGPVGGLPMSNDKTCSVWLTPDRSKCLDKKGDPVQPLYAYFMTTVSFPPVYVYSNGPCGQLLNGGDIHKKGKWADEDKDQFYWVGSYEQ